MLRLKALARPEPPHALAALRIVVTAMVLLSSSLREGPRIAALDPARWVVPEGLAFFVAHAPIGPRLALGVEVVTVFAALLALVGVRARPALAVMTAGATYLFALAALGGFVWHEMHLLWLGALLAASPCDHALAIDAARASPPALAYGVPLQLARALLGCVYFFPGVHKVAAQGLAWALGDNLRNQLLWKWFEHGEVGALRLDQHPTLLALGGLGVLAFELSAPLVFLHPRLRRAAAIAGLLFHLSAQLVFGIPFVSLWACYVVLVDVAGILRRVPALARFARGDGPRRAGRGALSAWVVGGALLAAAIGQGARGQSSSFPFACYPTFEHDPGTAIPDLEVRVRDASGEHVLPDPPRTHRTQRQWGAIWALAGVTAPVVPERLVAYYNEMGVDPKPLEVRFVRVDRSVVPEDGGAIVAEHELHRFRP